MKPNILLLSVSNTHSAEIVAKELTRYFTIHTYIDHFENIRTFDSIENKPNFIDATVLARYDSMHNFPLDSFEPLSENDFINLQKAKILFYESFDRTSPTPTSMKLKSKYFLYLASYFNTLIIRNPELKYFFSFKTPFFPWDILLKEVVSLHKLQYLSFFETKFKGYSFLTKNYNWSGKQVLAMDSPLALPTNIKPQALLEPIQKKTSDQIVSGVTSHISLSPLFSLSSHLKTITSEMFYEIFVLYFNLRWSYDRKWNWNKKVKFKSNISNLHKKYRSNIGLFILVYKYLLERYKINRFLEHRAVALNHIESQDVFFSLHLEPEGNTLPRSYPFQDQLSAITIVLNSIPNKSKVFLKRHPLQSTKISWRDIRQSNYLDLIELKNFLYVNENRISMIHDEVKNREIIKRVRFVASFDGTVNYEAALLGVPSVSFTSSWMEGLSNHFLVKSKNELQSAIGKMKKIDAAVAEGLFLMHLDSSKIYLVNFPIYHDFSNAKNLAANLASIIFKAYK